MRHLAIAGFVAAGLALAAVAYADQPPPNAASTPPPAQSGAPPAATTTANNDPLICQEEDELGSRLGGHKVCMTRSQWRHQAMDAQDSVNESTDRSTHFGPPGH